MLDLLALAYQTDLTRVSTFMLGREVSSRAYPEIGVSDSHHPLSHHGTSRPSSNGCTRSTIPLRGSLRTSSRSSRAMPEGDGTMLDNSLFLYGTGISDSNPHFHDDLPIAIVGGKAAGIKGGRYVRYPQGTPLANLHVTLLEKLGRAGREIRRQHRRAAADAGFRPDRPARTVGPALAGPSEPRAKSHEHEHPSRGSRGNAESAELAENQFSKRSFERRRGSQKRLWRAGGCVLPFVSCC